MKRAIPRCPSATTMGSDTRQGGQGAGEDGAWRLFPGGSRPPANPMTGRGQHVHPEGSGQHHDGSQDTSDCAGATAGPREPAYLSSGSGDPASLTTVGKMSMLLVGSAISSPAGITPGHRRRPGTRMPPSQLFPFPPKTQDERQEADGVSVSDASFGARVNELFNARHGAASWEEPTALITCI